MSALPRTDGIAERLEAIALGATGPSARRQALRLRARLLSPVRVVLLGLPGSGKIDLAAALAGIDALPAAVGSTTFELRYGADDESEITMSDGSVRVVSGPLEDHDLTGAALIVLKRPLPNLRRMSLLTIVADASPGEQRAAIAWARQRTDIAVWCSRDFDAPDLAVWSQVPDELKDHAFLALTGPDGARSEGLHRQWRQDFVDVLRLADIGVDAGRVAERLAEHAVAGQRIDTENALLFLRAHEAPERVRTRPGPSVATPEPAEAAGDPATPARLAQPAEAKPPRRANVSRPVVSSGFSYLRDRGDTLLREVRRGAAAPSEVMAHCGETLGRLSEMLAFHEDAATRPEIARLADTIMEAEAMVVLLGTEAGTEAALDAVSLLLQVRQDFEACIAA